MTLELVMLIEDGTDDNALERSTKTRRPETISPITVLGRAFSGFGSAPRSC